MHQLSQEGANLDKTLAMTNEIVSMGANSAQSLQGQTNRLRNTNRNLGKIEKSALPGADRFITMINKHQKKNTIILAAVISVCLVLCLYSLGFIGFLKKMT
jgi:hypothetical protein